MTDKAYVVWTEIPVSDMAKAMAFYDTVFGWSLELDESGPNPMAVFGGDMGATGGHIYPGTPAANGAGPTIHLAVPDALEAATERARGAGAKVLYGPIEIPPGRFTYIIDPDGNSIGLFEPRKAT
ncbi:glyoxalase [Oceanicola sp. 22II-s10i]|uniref:VOC family protein n=1 Tax=Oceanicola sp. 22II-s10i TaxID=1317116 RepID=UPI000B5278CF|nr:VOC family protein [Oceanicola sp. 22II-s10i]OWU86293.1 glyoxalase [Oceanicola sp. 22II-s10i]